MNYVFNLSRVSNTTQHNNSILRKVHCKSIFILLLMLSIFLNTKAQNEGLDITNAQLRQMFSPLLKPTPAKLFLYEMAAHTTDSIWYVTNCADTNQTETWYKVYDEMYHSAYDTTPFTKVENIITQANNFTNDTIPIGILNYSFYGLKPDAMSTNIYFNFDTINNILSDKNPRPSWPYTDNNTIFMAAPLINSTHFANPTFAIKPQFFYYDSYNASHFGKNGRLKIDFGDGTGWHIFDPQVLSYFQPNYATNAVARPIVRVQVIDPSTASILGSSTSSILAGPNVVVQPDGIIQAPGLNVGMYGGCGTGPGTGKTIIYLEGIDILDFIPSKNRDVTFIYDDMLRNNRVIELKNQGYKFVVVDWKNSRIDMRFNALYLVNLIQILKSQATDNEQYIIMGESMGGVIARFALTFMESREYMTQSNAPFFVESNDLQSIYYLNQNQVIYTLPTNWVNQDKMHNTRLLITLDSPHQGANVPLGIQKVYKTAIGVFDRYTSSVTSFSTYAFNLFLDGKAAKQLLIEHISTQSGDGFYKTYGNTSVRTSFMNQLQAMGGYPQYAKVMLMSNGSLSGMNQTNFYTGQPRTANDRFLDFKIDTYVKILGIKIPYFGGKLRVLTNPDGNGQILQANAGFYKVRIKFKWFGIRVYADYNSLLNVQEYANTKPYCVNAGGSQGKKGPVGTTAFNAYFNLSDNYWVFNLFSINLTNNGQGCLSLASHAGWNGFLSTNINFSLCSDGFTFCFVPTQSALDYGRLGTIPLNTNIEALPIFTKLRNIPQRVDIIEGIPRSIGGGLNRSHLYLRNDGILNLTNIAPPFPAEFDSYFSCINGIDTIRRGFLNLEIGDEELYLENKSLPYRAEYKVEFDLHVNQRNRYYEYPSLPFVNGTTLGGIYSRQNPYSITSTGFATFIFDGVNSPNIGPGFYGTTTGNFEQINEPLQNCCIRNMSRINGSTVFATKKATPINNNYLNIFPNPVSNNYLTLKYQFSKMGIISLNIINTKGEIVLNKLLNIPIGTKDVYTTIDIKAVHLPSGFYFVRLSNGKETMSTKLIVP